MTPQVSTSALPRTLDAQVRRSLDARHGTITSQELTALGAHPSMVRDLVRRGVLLRVARGVFVDRALLAGSGRDDQQRLRIRAVARAWAADVAVSHSSAVLMHELPLLVPETRIHGCRTAPGSYRRTPRWTIHSAYPEPLTTTVAGTRVVDPALAVLGVAEIQGRDACVVAGDAALHRGILTRDHLLTVAARVPRRPGHRGFVAAVELMDPLTESPGESLTRLVFADLGVPVRPQVRITDGRGRFLARVDFVITGTRVVVEFDGMSKYTDAEVLRAEKRREQALRRAGWTVLRLTWSDLQDAVAIRRLVEAAIADDRRRR